MRVDLRGVYIGLEGYTCT